MSSRPSKGTDIIDDDSDRGDDNVEVVDIGTSIFRMMVDKLTPHIDSFVNLYNKHIHDRKCKLLFGYRFVNIQAFMAFVNAKDDNFIGPMHILYETDSQSAAWLIQSYPDGFIPIVFAVNLIYEQIVEVVYIKL